MLPVKGFREWLHLEWWLYYTYLYCFERFLLACVVMNCHSSFSLSPFIVSQLVLNGTHGLKDIRRGGRGLLLISWNLENGFPCWSVFKKKYENKNTKVFHKKHDNKCLWKLQNFTYSKWRTYNYTVLLRIKSKDRDLSMILYSSFSSKYIE